MGVVDGGAVDERVGVVGGGAVGERVTGVVDTVTCNYNYSCSHSLQLSMYSSMSGDSGRKWGVGTCSALHGSLW